MAAHFDNLDDVNGKFAGTVLYYDKKAVICKQAGYLPDNEGEMALYISGLNGRYKYVGVKDPSLNYKDFNIGYSNAGKVATWWFRKPSRQYRQGLKKDQLQWRSSKKEVLHPNEMFTFNKPFVMMLENQYPHLEECKQALIDLEATVAAFHRDFALSWDDMHEDFILEYRGKRIGISSGRDLTKYKLIPEANHLREALQEALP